MVYRRCGEGGVNMAALGGEDSGMAMRQQCNG